jgi:hypothetical protein
MIQSSLFRLRLEACRKYRLSSVLSSDFSVWRMLPWNLSLISSLILFRTCWVLLTMIETSYKRQLRLLQMPLYTADPNTQQSFLTRQNSLTELILALSIKKFRYIESFKAIMTTSVMKMIVCTLSSTALIIMLRNIYTISIREMPLTHSSQLRRWLTTWELFIRILIRDMRHRRNTGNLG